jgi:hypothetical protein
VLIGPDVFQHGSFGFEQIAEPGLRVLHEIRWRTVLNDSSVIDNQYAVESNRFLDIVRRAQQCGVLPAQSSFT